MEMSEEKKRNSEEPGTVDGIEELKTSLADHVHQLATDVNKFTVAQEILEQAKKEHRQLKKHGDDVDDVIEACDQLGQTVRESGAKIANALSTMGNSIREAGDQINEACQESSLTMRKFSKLLGDTLVEAAERAAESSEDDADCENEG